MLAAQVDATCSYYFQVAPEEAFDLSPLNEKAAARFLEYTQSRHAVELAPEHSSMS